ncbi:DUF2721 domain-containing protein [Sphingorhabdus arenilitoris]|uniref:DUF2721 domain-containing protein n=1 Tax=Sphingorhabdus arenilitoris TaxID=1490041 RepID=A0ABV8RCQ7_9SPHN
MESTSSLLQSALTPAFLLVALGSMLGLFTGRLSRVVDRSRDLQAIYSETKGQEHDRVVAELRDLEKRIHIVNRAIACGVLSAITVSILIGILFVIEFTGLQLGRYAVGAFLIAIGLLASALILFMAEVRFAIRNVRISEEYLELPRRQKRD